MTFTRIGQTGQTLVGKSLPEDGSKRGGTELETKPQGSCEIAAWLGSQRPADMDKAAVSRASSHNVALTVKMDLRFPVSENGETLPSYMIAVGCDVQGSEADRMRAVADLRNFETPADTRQIEEWLAELSVITASRSREHMESALMLTAYASRLRQYPADVVRDAVLRKSWKWWPTWDELRQHCEMKAGPRRHMIAALSKPIPPKEPEARPPTQEERDNIQRLVDEKFPLMPSDMRKAAVDEALKGNCMKEAP